MGKSKGELLYELHKGKKAKYSGSEGVVVGFDDVNMIIAVTSGRRGWKHAYNSPQCTINQDSKKGYLFIDDFNILE